MPRTILALTGHIGDADLTTGPVMAKAIQAGDRGIFLALTYGERGHPTMSPADYKVQKLEEARQFAATLGAEYRTLDYSDGFLPDNDEVAEQIADIIRIEKPDIIISHWKHSIHRDHVHTYKAAERAQFLAGLPVDSPLGRYSVPRWLCADNWEDAEGFVPDMYVDIPQAAFDVWRKAIQVEAFARGETYGFRYIDYYCANMLAKGCLSGHLRACAFVDAYGNRAPIDL